MSTLEIISLFLCLAGGLQGVVLVLVLNKVFKEKNVDRKWLLVFISVVSATLLIRLLYLFPYEIDPRIPVFSDVVLYLYGPLYYFFLQSVFRDTSVEGVARQKVYHFIPAGLQLLTVLPLFLITLEEYVQYLQEGQIFAYFIVIMTGALIHNGVYWHKSSRLIRSITKAYSDESVRLSANYVYLMQWWYLSVLVSFAGMIVFYFFDFYLAGIGYQLTWMAASWMSYGLGYFVLSKPETFGDNLVELDRSKELEAKYEKQFERIANKLSNQLEEKRIFLDPEISLVRLAKLLETNNVLLSKTINQYFKVGFYGLINRYRVEEFIRLAQDPANSHFTYYALALQAGFNSKTSFNKYFKKNTGLTPKQYFRKLEVA